jgi:hypothetical protein
MAAHWVRQRVQGYSSQAQAVEIMDVIICAAAVYPFAAADGSGGACRENADVPRVAALRARPSRRRPVSFAGITRLYCLPPAEFASTWAYPPFPPPVFSDSPFPDSLGGNFLDSANTGAANAL